MISACTTVMMGAALGGVGALPCSTGQALHCIVVIMSDNSEVNKHVGVWLDKNI